MYWLIIIAWMYVVFMMAISEALSSQGSVLGAAITLIFYGIVPLSILLYLLGTPVRRARHQTQQPEPPSKAGAPSKGAGTPDCGSEAPGHTITPEGKEP